MMTLLPGEIQIWFAQADLQEDLMANLEKTLSQEERDAASRFRFSGHRLNYIFAHGVLRDILCRYMNCPAQDILFRRNSNGKPFLIQRRGRIPLLFNMSHSGSVVLVGVASECNIGVDLEEIRPLTEFIDIARYNFAPEECTFIMNHAPEDRQRAFLRCWTRKEAYIKAAGNGLSMPLNTFDISDAPEPDGWNLAQTADALTATKLWLADLQAPGGYLAAVAIEETPGTITYSNWHLHETV